MRRATALDHTTCPQGVVARVAVAHQLALPRPATLVLEEGPGVLASTADREVVDHRPQGLERPGGMAQR